MERVPCDDLTSESKGDGIFEYLCRSLQLLASPAQAQVNHFPAPWVQLTDEMALDFDHWTQCLTTYWKPTPAQMAQLRRLDDFLGEMSSSPQSDFWTEEALSSDPRWEEVRALAKAVLVSFGWPIEVPPPAQQMRGGLVDQGSSFWKSHASSEKAPAGRGEAHHLCRGGDHGLQTRERSSTGSCSASAHPGAARSFS
jgi:hypothetical protein